MIAQTFSIDDGVLIIFIHMKGVSYNPSRDTITLEPGASWGDALVTLEAQGVAPMGGRVRFVPGQSPYPICSNT